MIAAATWPREKPEEERLLWIDPGSRDFINARVGDLPSILRRGDLGLAASCRVVSEP